MSDRQTDSGRKVGRAYLPDNMSKLDKGEKRGKSCSLSPAFTLAEVLIVIGIIGVIAQMTIPTLVNNVQEQVFKVSYKKAFSDISNAMMQSIAENSLEYRTNTYDVVATESEFNALKTAFKVSKSCDLGEIYQCWANGESLCDGACGGGDGTSPGVPSGSSKSFVDAAGRSWAEYTYAENLYLVDTNGFKSPNKFGKDRWMFTLEDANNTRISTGYPAKVSVAFHEDLTVPSTWCHYPPCLYQSWIIGN